jgi:hypothetical protein
MEPENADEISPFIRAVMPTASLAEQREAERNLDRFLAVIDQIHARITREQSTAGLHDKHDDDATVDSSH